LLDYNKDMKKRIFISLNLPTDIKNQLVAEQQEIDRQFAYFCGNSPIKWTKKIIYTLRYFLLAIWKLMICRKFLRL